MNRARAKVGDAAKRQPGYVRWIDPRAEKVLGLRGNVDLECSSEVRKILLKAVAGKRHVLVDLSEVTHIDSSGIACLVEALHMARSRGADLGLVSVSAQAMRVLKLARLDKVFSISNRRWVEQVH